MSNPAATGHNGTLTLSIGQSSQNIGGNFSYDSWELIVSCSSSTTRQLSPVAWSVNVNGAPYSGTFTIDFRSGGTTRVIASGSTAVGHNPDGSKTTSYSASIGDTGTYGIGGPASVDGALYQTTIPRASTPSISPTQMTAGTAVTVNTNRASSAFTHTITYQFGAQSGTVGTGIGASVAWTPPLSLLSEIPNSVSGVITLTTTTYSGGANVGSKSASFALNVPSNIVPTIGSITATENVGQVSSTVGAFVQQLSKLDLAIVGAVGRYGSRIVSSSIAFGNQIIKAASGVSSPLAVSGSVVISATVTDSRGRTGTLTKTITVLPYSTPTVDTSSFQVERAFVDGTLHDDGTYLKVSLSAAVQSLVNGSQKNALSYRISTRLYGTTVWTTAATAAPGGTSYSINALLAGYSIDHSWDVLVEISDNFATTGISSTAPTAAIFMHWDGSLGMGIGKYRENGMLDVSGQVYQNDGKAVLDVESIQAILAALLPAGNIELTGRADAPNGWLICDGSAVSRTTYAALFSAIGTTYGQGNYSTTFNLPDLKGRVGVGRDTSQSEFTFLNSKGGEKTHLLTAAESGLRDHTHQLPLGSGTSIGGTGDHAARSAGISDAGFRTQGSSSGSPYNSPMFGNASAQQSHNNLQPYITLNYIIKT